MSTTSHKLVVFVLEGEIADFQADAIVNSTSINLQLESTGYLSKSISRAAGPRLQQECRKQYPNTLRYGEVAVTDGFELKCFDVYHGGVPAWDSEEVEDPLKILCTFVNQCFELAHNRKRTSIALPALGCGFPGYPPTDSARAIFECIKMFNNTHPETSLDYASILIFSQGSDTAHTKQAFQRELDLYQEERDKQGDMLLKTHYRRLVRPVLERTISWTSKPCRKVLACKHRCRGFHEEKNCPPCLEKDCPGNKATNQTLEDDCMICYTDELHAAPVCALKCSHVFHVSCLKRILESRWVGPRITFNFTLCPVCKEPIDHPALKTILEPIKTLQEDVQRKALMRAQYENLDKSDDVTKPDRPYYRNVLKLALNRYCYYQCFKCKKAYFGGLAECGDGAEGDFEESDLVCSGCSGTTQDQVCKTHGTDYLEYKCRYCCTVAVFFCMGHTHYCQRCHDGYLFPDKFKLPVCPAGPCGQQLQGKCPLNVKHPPTGTEFAIGCCLCANMQTF